MFKAKKKNQKPPVSEIKPLSRLSRRLYQLWDQLTLIDDKLYRLYQQESTAKVVLYQLVMPESEKTRVLTKMHSGTLGGHLGEDKTMDRVRERYYWPDYHYDVCDWYKTCPDCAATEMTRNKRRVKPIQIQTEQDRSSRYNDKAHGKPFEQGDLVWLHSTVVPKGVGRKLHHPWTGPFRVVKKLSDSVYRLQNPRSSRNRLIVHFDRLKLCPEGVRLPTIPPKQKHMRNNSMMLLTLVHPADDDPLPDPILPNPVPPERRYPRAAPDRLIPYIEF